MKLGQEIDENTVIYQDEAMIYLIGIHATLNDLKWHDDGDIAYLTLKEIHQQLPYPIRIICESGLDGKIYEFGNYNDGKWRLHGITKGYA